MERCLWRLENPGIQERADTILLDISVRNNPALGLNVIKTESACGRKAWELETHCLRWNLE